MLITDQVATAPCTDRVQARRPTFEVFVIVYFADNSMMRPPRNTLQCMGV